jgi:hypothetical protein
MTDQKKVPTKARARARANTARTVDCFIRYSMVFDVFLFIVFFLFFISSPFWEERGATRGEKMVLGVGAGRLVSLMAWRVFTSISSLRSL